MVPPQSGYLSWHLIPQHGRLSSPLQSLPQLLWVKGLPFMFPQLGHCSQRPILTVNVSIQTLVSCTNIPP